MKLRNKKTGEIATLTLSTNGEDLIIMGNDMYAHITKLSELKDYADYEEDELLYVVSAEHRSGYQCVLKEDYPEICKVAKELGIGFETEKECQKAVEKLKAWKRLKDKGFRITMQGCKGNAWLQANWGNLQGDYSDVLLLFGGEE